MSASKRVDKRSLNHDLSTVRWLDCGHYKFLGLVFVMLQFYIRPVSLSCISASMHELECLKNAFNKVIAQNVSVKMSSCAMLLREPTWL